jgi:hypothetical protein
MHEMKRGKLKSGRSGKQVKSRKQAVAIGLWEARRSGAKVPSKKEVIVQDTRELTDLDLQAQRALRRGVLLNHEC